MTTAADQDLAASLRAVMDGEVSTEPRRRAEYSTDASNYRVVPAVVACPRDTDELQAALEVARTHDAHVTMRGGGTSVAGNAIGPGLVLDTSRHLTKIHEINPDKRTARVEPGVVLQHLQRAAAPHGLRFGPDPSTQSRATIGGMIGNNACGPHAIRAGKTADNVHALDVIDGQGRRYWAREGLDPVPGLDSWVADNLALIRTECGRFSRQVSGYSLEHLLPENDAHLARFLVGTEGTLATVLEAEVRLVEMPPARVMGLFGYPDMPAAADAVTGFLPHTPEALEGLDSRLVDRVRAAGTDVPELPPGAGWLFVEMGGESEAEAREALTRAARDAGTTHVRIVEDPAEANALWRIRADGAGLAGRTPEGAEAWPGWEDAAVPPERLGAYLRDFDALMDAHGVTGQPFGHFGDGCVHVRLDIPLRDSAESLENFVTEAATLVTSHGGSLSGEHGDGRARSALLPAMYSAEALAAFAQVKAFFDPAGRLNPGIVVDPAPVSTDVRRPFAPVSTHRTGLAFAHDHGDLTEAVHRCTGVGVCRSDAVASGTGFMCPSFAATGDEKDVTRGRARVLQEAINGGLVHGLSAPEVEESLDLCLSCKACSRDCPSGVDMASYKTEVLHRTYDGKRRPLTHYTIGRLPMWLRTLRPMARLVNAVTRWRPLEALLLAGAGMDTRRHVPRLATTSFDRSASARARAADGGALTGSSRDNSTVVLWADSFSTHIDPDVPQAMVELLEAAGLKVLVAGGEACCGVSYISTGQLDAARERLQALLQVLGPFAVNGIPIVGVEPSCIATLRSDLVELLPDDPRAHAVAQGTYTCAEVLTGDAGVTLAQDWKVPSLAGRQVVVQPHCHHYSVMGFDADRALLEAAGAHVTEASGCCGLAGNWGVERGHYDTSVAIAHTSLVPSLDAAGSDAVFLADGISCRTQGEDVAGVQGLHLAQLLRDASKPSVTPPSSPATR